MAGEAGLGTRGGSGRGSTFVGDMAFFTTAVASLGTLGGSAIVGDMAFFTAGVAGLGIPGGRTAVTGYMAFSTA